MTCFSPLKGSRILDTTNNSYYVSLRDKDLNHPDRVGDIFVSCKQCIGCRLERSRQWAMRCVHEASLHTSSCFLTLTYNEESLPKNGSLNKKWFLGWLKRFRERIRYHYGRTVRFLCCGEYGSKRSRPHFHVLLFGFDFSLDRYLFRLTGRGDRIYRSPFLEDAWPFGFSTIGAVTFESCAYVARYVVKKINGKKAKEHYSGLEPEFINMSRRPGIGSAWFEKNSSDVYPLDKVVFKGKTMRPPEYYDQLLKRLDMSLYHVVKDAREEKFIESDWYLMSEDERQLELNRKREHLQRMFTKYLKRNYEEQLC